MADQCQQLKSNGARCLGAALPGKVFCYYHDPESAAKRRAAQSRGGKARSKPRTTLPPDTPDVPAATLADLAKLLEATINQTRRGELDPKVANCLGYLASVQQRVLQMGDLEQRLLTLEKQINGGAK